MSYSQYSSHNYSTPSSTSRYSSSYDTTSRHGSGLSSSGLSSGRYGLDGLSGSRHGLDSLSGSRHGLDTLSGSRHGLDSLSGSRHGLDSVSSTSRYSNKYESSHVPSGHSDYSSKHRDLGHSTGSRYQDTDYSSKYKSNYDTSYTPKHLNTDYSSKSTDYSSRHKYDNDSSYTPKHRETDYSSKSTDYSSKSADYSSKYKSDYTPKNKDRTTDYSSKVKDDDFSVKRKTDRDAEYSSKSKAEREEDTTSRRKLDKDVDTSSRRRAEREPIEKNTGDGDSTEARRRRIKEEVEEIVEDNDNTVTRRRQVKEEVEEVVHETATPLAAGPITTKTTSDIHEVTQQTENLSVSSRNEPRESGRFQEIPDGATPPYKPYTNPGLQSNSFKALQNVVETGRDNSTSQHVIPTVSVGLNNHTVNAPSVDPKKYTPSQTWQAVHSDGRVSPINPATVAKPYQPLANSKQSSQPAPTNSYSAPANNYSAVANNHSAPANSYSAPANSHTASTNNYTMTPSPAPSKLGAAPKPFSPAGSPGLGSKVTSQVPCGDLIATKGTSGLNQASGDPQKTPVCSQCHAPIRGPFVLALNKSWCPNHFTCAKCGSELINMGFVELNGKIYCENDYESSFAPKCAKCHKPIVGDTVNALDKTWHPACFICTACNKPITTGAFHVEDGKPYCMPDWQKLFQTKCVACTFPVEPGDKWIEALDANWHSECFVCSECRVPLEGKPFYPKNNKPYCKEHIHAAK